MNDWRINKLERTPYLEKAIDKRAALHFLNFDSLSLYLDLLLDSVDRFESDGSTIDRIRVTEFIRTRPFPKNFTVRDIFSIEEFDYIKRCENYVNNLKEKLIKPSLSHWHLANAVIQCAKGELASGKTVDQTFGKIIEVLKENNAYGTFVSNSKFNRYIEFSKLGFRLYLIDNVNLLDSDSIRVVSTFILYCDYITLSDKIKKCAFIKELHYIDDGGRISCCDVSSPLSDFIWNIEKILSTIKSRKENSLESQKIIERLKSIQNDAIFLNPGEEPISSDVFSIDEIKHLREKIKHIYHDHFYNLDYIVGLEASRSIKFLSNILSSTFNFLKNKFSIELYIKFSISEIKKNNSLYVLSKGIKKSEEIAFGEENLTALLASNLRCLFREQRRFSIDCEARVGAGRSDIRISSGGKPLCIIESKLIRDKVNIKEDMLNAIDQLYSRYSENEGVFDNSDILLHLVVFTYDKDFRRLSAKIEEAVEIYSQRNSLTQTIVDVTECGFRFSYLGNQGNHLFKVKQRVISVTVCNMEIDYKSARAKRTAKKNYDTGI